MSKQVTPQTLTESAREFAPLFVNQSKDHWDLICKLIATELTQEYQYGIELNNIRVFILDSNTGINDPVESIYFPVVAKNTEEGVKEKEAAISPPELTMAQLQDTEDVLEKVARGSGSYRVSSSTGEITVYGTSGINTGTFGTTQYILNLQSNQLKDYYCKFDNIYFTKK